MARRKKKANQQLDVAKKMPPLAHGVVNRSFDVSESEVCKWLVKQPEILQFVFDAVVNTTEQSQRIVFDPELRKWRGVEFDD